MWPKSSGPTCATNYLGTDGYVQHRDLNLAGWSRSCRLQYADGQRQSYNSAASRTIGDPSLAAVRLYDCIHKSKPEAVPGRMVPFYEALESPAANLRRESRAIVFDNEFC